MLLSIYILSFFCFACLGSNILLSKLFLTQSRNVSSITCNDKFLQSNVVRFITLLILQPSLLAYRVDILQNVSL